MRTPKTRDPRSCCRWPRFPSAPTPVRVTVEAPPGPSAELARLRRGRATRPAGQEAPRRLQRHLPPWAGRGPGRMPPSRRPTGWAVCQRRAGMLACCGAPARGALGRARRERGRVCPRRWRTRAGPRLTGRRRAAGLGRPIRATEGKRGGQCSSGGAEVGGGRCLWVLATCRTRVPGQPRQRCSPRGPRAAALASPRPTREGRPCPAPCRSRAQGPALVPRRGLSSGVGRVVPGQ